MDSFNKLRQKIKSGLTSSGNFMSQSVKSIYDSSANTFDKTLDKTGFKKMYNKLWNLQSFDESDLLDIVMILIAIITIVIVVFYLPKFNKTATAEKKIFDSKFFKFIVCLFLFYAFYFYDLPLFCMCLVIVFLFFWFHHGCFTEHMIGEEITKELNKKPAVVVRIEGGEIIVDDVDKFKQMIISDKIDEIKEIALKENEDLSFGDKIKSFASSASNVATGAISSATGAVSSVASTITSPITNLFNKDEEVVPENLPSPNQEIEEPIQNKEIFDQRDFMIMPENAPERQGTFERICDCTRCTKPTSYVDNPTL